MTGVVEAIFDAFCPYHKGETACDLEHFRSEIERCVRENTVIHFLFLGFPGKSINPNSVSGYAGPQFRNAVRKILPRLKNEIVKRSDTAKGFEVLPRRWVVERTFAWLGRCRRLAKDWECRTFKSLAFLLLASIRSMLRKLCNPT